MWVYEDLQQGVYVPCIYMHASCQLLSATQVFVVVYV